MKRFFLALVFACLSFGTLAAQIQGAADLGATWLKVDVLESGKTVDTLYMRGVRGEATVAVYQGLAVKPLFLFAWGHGDLATGSLAVGYYLPVAEKWRIFPNFGGTLSYLSTKIDVEVDEIPGLRFEDVKERFRSSTAFLGLDVHFLATDKITVRLSYQYGWSHTHTKLSHKEHELPNSKGHSCGGNYALGVDYAVTPSWSITAGAAYNITLSKEKHGLRGCGGKLGVSYYF